LEISNIFHAEETVFSSKLAVVISAARLQLWSIRVNNIYSYNLTDIGKGFILTHDQ